jgi:hypothetical protein
MIALGLVIEFGMHLFGFFRKRKSPPVAGVADPGRPASAKPAATL